MLFWFRFIFPNLNYIESGHAELAIKKIRANLVDAHIAYVYEDVCIEKMWELNAGDTWDFHFNKVGRWWNNNTEIDIVALDKEGNHIIFGECKYWTNKVGMDVLWSLEKKAEQVEWKRGTRKSYFILFSINGFTDELMDFSKERKDLVLIS